MMLVIDEQELVAWTGIREADAARIAGRALVRDASDGAMRRKVRIRKREQVREALGRQAGNAKVHRSSPSAAHDNMEKRWSRTHPISVESPTWRFDPSQAGCESLCSDRGGAAGGAIRESFARHTIRETTPPLGAVRSKGIT